MKKKIIYMLLAMSLNAMLTACGHEHTWVDASCTQPRTCSECGEMEGDVLEHTWVDVTCAEPKHCSVCGTTEGEALPHTLTKANYQQPATCEICGETEGDKLQADFEKYGLNCNIEWDVPYTYKTKNHEGYNSVGTIVFSDYEVISFDEDLEEKEGYEWRVFNATMTWNDNDAENINCSSFDFLSTFQDYYDIERMSDSYVQDTFTIDYNGADYAECMEYREKTYDSWENNGFKMIWKYAIRVPEGYDGIVFAVVDDRSVEIADGSIYFNDFANENTGCLRIN